MTYIVPLTRCRVKMLIGGTKLPLVTDSYALARWLRKRIAEEINMFSIKFHNAVKNLAFIFALVFGLALASVNDVSAQGKGRDVGRDRGNGRVVKGDTNVDDEWQDGRWRNTDDRRDERWRDQNNERYNGRDRQGNQSLRFAYQQGYNAGFREGMRDARNRDRSGNDGSRNRHGWGNSAAWRNAYNNGFNRGYRDGFNRYRSQRNMGDMWPY